MLFCVLPDSNISFLTTKSTNKCSFFLSKKHTSFCTIVWIVCINCKCGQSTAAIESRPINASHRTRNIDRGQRTAAIESPLSNASHGTWNIDGGQRTAATESEISNASHGTWNIDGGQRSATLVFVYCFISAFYALKGRKVKS